MRELSNAEIEVVSGAGIWDSICDAVSAAWDWAFGSGGNVDPAGGCDFLPSGSQICSNSAETIKYYQAQEAYAICEAEGNTDCVAPEPPKYSK